MTSLPVLYVCNVEEAAAAIGNEYSRKVEQRAAEEGAACVVISAKIESEIAVLPRDEREMFLSEIGLKEPGLDRLIRAGYGLLHLVTFFTVGPKETRAWTVTRRHARTAGARASSIRISSAASSAPRPSRMTITSRAAARPARATSASCASKARTTSSPTAT